MSLIAKLMLRDAVDSLKGRDPALAEEIIRRDEEVDRFYLFIIRQLTMAVLNRSLILEIGLADPRDCLVYRVVSKSLERIADHATTIAKMSASIENPLPPRLVEKFVRVVCCMGSAVGPSITRDKRIFENLVSFDIECSWSSDLKSLHALHHDLVILVQRTEQEVDISHGLDGFDGALDSTIANLSPFGMEANFQRGVEAPESTGEEVHRKLPD